MARIYLAASYGRKEEMRKYRDQIHKLDIGVVTSRWIDRPGTSDVNRQKLNERPDDCVKFALDDLEDMEASNCFIIFTGDDLSTGGRHTEYGMSLRMRNIVAVYIIGPRENVFQCFNTRVFQFDNWTTFVSGLEAARNDAKFASIASNVLYEMMYGKEE